MTKTETKSTVLLKHHLKALKLPTMLAECEKIAQRCVSDNADHLAFLLQLSELELIERERKSAERRLKAARFPAAKLLDEFDFSARLACSPFSDPRGMRVSEALRGKERLDDEQMTEAAQS